MIISLAIAAVAVALDQIFKGWVLTSLKPVGDIPIWNNVLHLHYVENTGAAFGLFQQFHGVLTIVRVLLVLGAIAYLIWKGKETPRMVLVCIGLIIGGAVGNLIDTVRFSFVVDYIYVKIINFAVFNLADSCIVVGAILLAVYLLFFEGRRDHAAEEPQIEDHD